jgi:hypothetical protein
MLPFFMLAAIDSSSWYSDPRHLRDLIRLIGYPLAFIAAWIAGIWYRHRQKIALAWPCVEGHVQFVHVAPIRDSSSYSANLEYSYFFGEYLSGSYTEVFDSENDATEFVEKMKDQKVPVRYNPKKPDDSLIEEADVEQYIELPPYQAPTRLA